MVKEQESAENLSTLTRFVCWANAIIVVPYLVSAVHQLYLTLSDAVFREYQGGNLWILDVLYIAFYCLFIYGLVRFLKWSRWLVLIDAILCLLFIFTFPVAGAYMMGGPSEFVYRFWARINEFALFSSFIAKAAISTFNIFYFFGGRIFRLAKTHRVAHALWLLPSIFLVGVPLYVGLVSILEGKKHESRSAKQIAEQEFKKLTCKEVRENNGKEITYEIEGHEVKVTFNYDFTGVWVKAPDGRDGSDGGPKYFCRPNYSGPAKE
jgi:hypothetical protein